ncbi:MAG: CoA transferase subunit A [Acidimicrobiales bacterium]
MALSDDAPDKVFESALGAVADIGDGATICVGGFGLCGVPINLVRALLQTGAQRLGVVSNNCGVDDWGLGLLLRERRIAKMTSSYVGENHEFARQYLSGEIEVELVPQGTLAERLRAGGSGIPAFYTPAGVGTVVAEGGLVRRYNPDGTIAVASAPKETREFGGRTYVLEHAITTDFALVRAAVGDEAGNLIFHASARNFNPVCAMAGHVTVAEVERIVGTGELEPDDVHLPGIFVQRVVLAGPDKDKRVERRTVRARGATEANDPRP